ncbi:ABC transporter permease [Winogradskyella endarachnes]|uniref:FtsX-like permease family protein n=1 Tax=Winogradskyella endarachnes TaxID=2681965 RepID=A0A6L6U4V4_9FLAO|nr:ABC transporter permease [Winogradskyella endarachnes]MUU77111.1 FtsX-like permease family protein [Winogradskyella endarachnes]
MIIWRISIKNLFHKPLYTILSIISLTISIGLLICIEQIDNSIKQQFNNNLGHADIVIGAKGSPLQLVLASVLHIDNPTGNISYAEAKKIAKNRLIKTAIPLSYGDNYKGYRIVGTTNAFSKFYKTKIAKGIDFKNPMEVVLGYKVAKQTGLKIGDKFLSSHGLNSDIEDTHNTPLIVVGIYEESHQVIDRLIITPLETVWDVHNHSNHTEHTEHAEHAEHKETTKTNDHLHQDIDEDHHTETHQHAHTNEENKEITSMLIKFRNAMGLITIPRQINENTTMQAAIPKYEIERLFNFTGIGVKAISWVAYIILFISSLMIFINLYKMVKERAFDLAMLRTFGASNFQLIKIVALEGFITSIISIVFGVLLSQIGLLLVLQLVDSQYQQTLRFNLEFINVFQIAFWVFILVIIAICFAVIPILKMNLSKILSNEN